MKIFTLYQRKLFLNRILSRELYRSSFKINAYYESSHSSKAARVKTVSDSVISLGINVASKPMKEFCPSKDAMKLTLIFRAYYIAALICCLEKAENAIPDNYFEGLVTLQSALTLASKKKSEFYIPDPIGKNKRFRAIDVYCAHRAMTRIMIEQRESLAEQTINACMLYTDILINYTLLPEVQFTKSGIAEFSSVGVMSDLKTIAAKDPEMFGRYAVFKAYGIDSVDSTLLYPLFKRIENAEGGFWQEMTVRLIALSGIEEFALTKQLEQAYLEFDKSGVEYRLNMDHGSHMLNENWRAIKIILNRAEKQNKQNKAATSGRVHLIR